MPSLSDSVVIFVLALMLLGPKKLPQLARQLGKLMGEFRKASNDFRMQMEDELRIEDQKEHQKKVDALAPPPSSVADPTIPTEDPPHPHTPVLAENSIAPVAAETAVQPIAESGELKMMPPSTGLPLESSARRGAFASSNTGRDGYDAPVQDAVQDAVHEAVHESGTGMSSSGTGMSSEEPMDDASVDDAVFEPAPDRSHPAMVGEGERATHA